MTESADWGANFAGSSMAAYEDALVRPLFVPWAEHLLETVGVHAGDSVLDVACGPGTVAQLAFQQSRQHLHARQWIADRVGQAGGHLP